jgi:hypothetical protein
MKFAVAVDYGTRERVDKWHTFGEMTESGYYNC